MSIRTLLSRLPKRTTAAVSVLAAVLLVPAALYAWGPSRTTYTVEHPADHNVFDSITDNPVVGDERQFVGIKDATNTSSGGWQANVNAQAGHEYLVRVYVHNNAASNLNLTATNTRVTAALSTATSTKVPITAYITADNANPGKVWADASLSASTAFNIAYVPGSAIIYNNATGQAGRKVSDSIVDGGGALVGYKANDGNWPGCFQYAGYITFKVKAQFPSTPQANFTVTKQVRKSGTTGWNKNVTVNPGDSVDYLITYNNTGKVAQDNVVVKDTLPAGVSYEKGTTYVANATNPNGIKVSDNIVSSQGINIGNYAPSANAYIKFTAKVAANDNLPKCGTNTLDNIAKVETDQGTKQDNADVTVNRTCTPPPVTPVYTCDLLTIDKISDTQFKFSTKYTVKNATLKSISYVVKDASGKQISSSTNSTYTQTTPGTYSVQAYVTATVNGTDKTVTNNTGCVGHFTVKAPETHPGVTIVKTVDGVKDEEVQVGKNYEYEVTVKNTGDIDLKNVKVTDAAPAGVTFVSADQGTVANNAWNYTIPTLKVGESQTFKITAVVKTYFEGSTTNKACVDASEVPGSPDACDTATVHVPTPPTPPVQIVVCDLDTKSTVTINESDFDSSKYSKTLSDCQPVTPTPTPTPTPTTPVATSLPTTGISGAVGSIVGLGSLVAALSYYVASRRS